MLYHKNLGLPKGFNSNVGTVTLNYGRHALNAAATDRYGRINLPKSVNTKNAVCIEVELIDGAVTKLVYRMSYNETADLVLAVSPRASSFFVRTVWLNLKSDGHATLDVSKYDRP